MGKITVETCEIEGLKVITPAVFGDSRGYFMETYNYNDYKEAGIDQVFVALVIGKAGGAEHHEAVGRDAQLLPQGGFLPAARPYGGVHGVEDDVDALTGPAVGDELLLALNADGLAYLFAVPESDQRGDAEHAEALSDVRVIVHIELADLDLAAYLLLELIEDRALHTAGAAPLRPEINDNKA